jgi:hypothetical protein
MLLKALLLPAHGISKYRKNNYNVNVVFLLENYVLRNTCFATYSASHCCVGFGRVAEFHTYSADKGFVVRESFLEFWLYIRVIPCKRLWCLENSEMNTWLKHVCGLKI